MWSLFLISLVIFWPQPLRASDHGDAPAVVASPQLDISDFYFFRSPSNDANVVFIVNVNAHESSKLAEADVFDDTGKYTVFVDTNGDAIAEAEINVFFDDANRRYVVFVGQEPISAAFGAMAAGDGMKAFAGFRDDSAFFDFEGFANFFATFCARDGGYSGSGIRCENSGKPENFFAKYNVGSFVVEVPIATLTGSTDSKAGTLRAWVKSFKRTDAGEAGR